MFGARFCSCDLSHTGRSGGGDGPVWSFWYKATPLVCQSQCDALRVTGQMPQWTLIDMSETWSNREGEFLHGPRVHRELGHLPAQCLHLQKGNLSPSEDKALTQDPTPSYRESQDQKMQTLVFSFSQSMMFIFNYVAELLLLLFWCCKPLEVIICIQYPGQLFSLLLSLLGAFGYLNLQKF